jgi:hypothetical protein
MVVVPAEGDNDTSETTAALAEAPRPVPPLAEDVPCLGCGYNLRGLASTGRCPECGRAAHGSVVRHRARGRMLPPPDPRWARQIVEGVGLSLLAFALFAALCTAPSPSFTLDHVNAPYYETPGRAVMLSAAVSAWVLAWYAAWKLTARPPYGESPRLRAFVARWALSLHLLVPFLIPAFGRQPGAQALVMLLALFVSGVAGVATLTGWMAQLFRRLGMRRTALESATLAVVNPAAVVFAFLLPAGHGGTNSLDLMLDLPMHPYGMAAMVRAAIHMAIEGDDQAVIAGLFVAVSIWNALLMTRLLIAYRPHARRPVQERNESVPSFE